MNLNGDMKNMKKMILSLFVFLILNCHAECLCECQANILKANMILIREDLKLIDMNLDEIENGDMQYHLDCIRFFTQRCKEISESS